MNMKKVSIAVCLLWLLAMVGCGSSNPMVGTWSLKMNEDLAKMMPAGQTKPTVTIDFKSDNTFEAKMNMDGKKEQTMSGTYELKEKTLTLTSKMEDGKPSTDKPETVTLADDMKSFPLPGAGSMMGSMVKN